MQPELRNEDENFDFFNYFAIDVLELLGNREPNQLEIDIVEEKLRSVVSESFNTLTKLKI